MQHQILTGHVREIMNKFDNLFARPLVDNPTPNRISENEDKTVDLNSLNPTSLPKNVKLEIEGGDNTHMPYGY